MKGDLVDIVPLRVRVDLEVLVTKRLLQPPWIFEIFASPPDTI